LKLLLDQNLSYRIVTKLQAAFPGSSHVKRLNLDTAEDKMIWQYAKDNGFTIVTQDSDFHELATLYGAPPKVIWLKCGNRPRSYIQSLLLAYQDSIKEFDQENLASILEIG
jgi:predicted nuclease of predicted toxin-antitoxin system